MQNSDQSKRPSALLRNRIIPDYTSDRYWASVLAKKIQNYHHRAGNLMVKVWVETRELSTGKKLYDIRSNIIYDCEDLV